EPLLAQLPLAPAHERRQAFEALRSRLLQLARPILLLVDDLQWADLDSLSLLEVLFAPGTGLPILLVGNYRREEAQTNAFLSGLLGTRQLAPSLCSIEQLALEPLTVPDARALASQLAEHVDEVLLASARGVPFLLVEAALAGAHPALREVDALLDLRLQRGSRGAQALLELLAVAGHPLPIALALRAADAPFSAALELVTMRGVRFRDLAGERCLEPYHDRVRDRVRVPPERARALHLRIANGMEELGLHAPLRRVEHLRAAGEDERAARLALQAAELACAQLAWSRAADLFAFALSLGHGERRRLADVLAFAGRHAEAAQHYLAADSLRLAAQQLVRAGEVERGVALLWQGLAASGVALPRSTLAANLALVPSRLKTLLALRRVDHSAHGAHEERLRWLETVYRELWLTHPVQSSLAHDLYCREAMRAGPREKMMALTMEAVVRTVADGPAARTESLLRQAETLASGSAYDTALLLIVRGIVALHSEGRPHAAIAPLERADALLAACPGTQFEREWAAFALDHALELSGRLRALVEVVRVRQRHAHPMRVISAPLVMLLEDRPDDALALLAVPRPRMPFLDHIALSRVVSTHLYRGEPQAAYAQLAAGCRSLRWELALQSRTLRESTTFERARCAAALYVHTREPRWKQAFERRGSMPARMRMLAASIAFADGEHGTCRALLRAAREEFARSLCEHGVACARAREAQLDGSTEGLDWFVSEGVADPTRWLNLSGYWG
ncbi:MAG TPA: hypothetical protein VFX59_21665, partial [Polyangiales bacterium]|nr:hypothetical protein [Polyangiales bacterium]